MIYSYFKSKFTDYSIRFEYRTKMVVILIDYQGGMNIIAKELGRKIQNDMLISLAISKVHEHLKTSRWTYKSNEVYFTV